MRIKSNLNNNTSVMTKSAHVKVPAGATLELDDKLYLEVESKLKPLVDAGKLVILKGVSKSKEQLAEEAEKQLEAARKLVAEADKAAKEEKTTEPKTVTKAK